jgi:hypothetical protein
MSNYYNFFPFKSSSFNGAEQVAYLQNYSNIIPNQIENCGENRQPTRPGLKRVLACYIIGQYLREVTIMV